MQHECKITVLDKKCFADYQEQYLADPKSGPCPLEDTEMEILMNNDCKKKRTRYVYSPLLYRFVMRSIFYGLLAVVIFVFCSISTHIWASEGQTGIDPDILGVSTSYPPGAYIISQKDYDVFVRGVEDLSLQSLTRLGASIEDIKYLMDYFPNANMIAFPAGETMGGGATIGFINIFPDNYAQAKGTFREILNGSDPDLLNQILHDMGASSLDDVDIYESEECLFLYGEGTGENGESFCHYITMFGTTVLEINAQTHVEAGNPVRSMDTVRKMARDLADSLHTQEYLDRLTDQIRSDEKEQSLQDLLVYLNRTSGEVEDSFSIGDGMTYHGIVSMITEDQAAEFYCEYDPMISGRQQTVIQVTITGNAKGKYRLAEISMDDSLSEIEKKLAGKGYRKFRESPEDDTWFTSYMNDNQDIVFTIRTDGSGNVISLIARNARTEDIEMYRQNA